MATEDPISNTRSRDYQFADLVRKAEGQPAPDIAYVFSSGRKFECPAEFGGVYADDNGVPLWP